MKNNRLQFLLKLLVDHEINEQELEELASLLSQPDNEEAIDAQFKNTWDNVGAQEELSESLYSKITDHPRFSVALHQEKVPKIKPNRILNLWYYAAATVLVCCSVGLGIYFYQSGGGHPQKAIRMQHAQLSGKSKKEKAYVTLTLSSGKELALDEAAVGKIVTEDHVVITKSKDGQLVYDLSKTVDDGNLAYNTITTPVGSNYQVVLSDGTKVWLNAKSSLKFPVVFKGAERRVELSGEAYFEVAHNKKQPFLLTAKEMNVQVLGTHFNVSAYDDDQTVKASLLEGTIKANYNNASLLLKPGQQALLKNEVGSLTQHSFDADEVMDWRNGYFIFRNEPINEIMKKISRWYHIEVNYQGQLSKEAFGGKYLKSNSLTELLSSLELTGTVKFRIEGRRVTVMQ
ncbi:fec operon regulator FecR [compost metagenome]